MMKELKVKLLKDVGNKAKGSVVFIKGNTAARLINKGRAEYSEDKINIIFTKEAKEMAKKKKNVEIKSIKAK